MGSTVDEGFAGRVSLAGVGSVVDLVIEDFGIDAGEAGEEPGVADDIVEEGALDGGLGRVIAVEGFGEEDEFVGVFASDDGARPRAESA